MSNSKITPKKIADFLIQNPDFLKQNLNLYKKLELHHERSTGLSLLERQIQVFREEEKRNQLHLETFIDNVRENQKLVEGIIGLSAEIQRTRVFKELIEVINFKFIKYFPVKYYSFKFIKNSFDIELMSDQQSRYFSDVIKKNVEVCGDYNQSQLDVMFSDCSTEIQSMAMIPISSSDAIAILALGSSDKDEYSTNKGTEFLKYLRIIIGSAFERFSEYE